MVTQLVVSVFLAIVVSALCSIFEAVLYSVPLSHVELLAQSGKIQGRILKKLKTNIHKPITAILTLNTIANTVGAAVAGAAAVFVFGKEYLVWFSGIFTFVILIFSEILPKTAGVAYHKKLAPWFALPINGLVIMLTPIIWACQAVTRLIPKHGLETAVSAEEILVFATLGRKSGEINLQEEKVIKNILELKTKTVRDVMTPRTVTFTLSEHLTVKEAWESNTAWASHSRVPVYDNDPDDVVGIVLSKDLLLKLAEDKKDLKLADLMNPVHFVPETASLHMVLMDFFEYHQHLFVVVDEYGGVTGVISLEDVIEEIVGREIMDESDKARDMRDLARRKRRILTGSIPDATF